MKAGNGEQSERGHSAGRPTSAAQSRAGASTIPDNATCPCLHSCPSPSLPLPATSSLIPWPLAPASLVPVPPQVLGLQRGASEAEVRRAKRQAALAVHPDKLGHTTPGANEAFHLVAEVGAGAGERGWWWGFACEGRCSALGRVSPGRLNLVLPSCPPFPGRRAAGRRATHLGVRGIPNA